MKRVARWIGYVLGGVAVGAVLAVAGIYAGHLVLRGQEAAKREFPIPPGVAWSGAVEINGIPQYLTIRGRDERNPVLLFLHGGPGTPMSPFGYVFQGEWENEVTVVHWDQRNAGRTYLANDPELLRRTTNTKQISDDALAVVDYLRARFHKDKIAVIGHSWGTIFGTPLVHAHPDLFCAYIGTGQVVQTIENEALGYRHTLEEAKRRSDQEAIRELSAMAPYPEPDGSLPHAKMDVLRKWEGRYRFMLASSDNGILWPMLKFAYRSPDYPLSAIRFFFLDFGELNATVDREINRFDARRDGISFDVPMFFIMGENDWQTPAVLTKKFYEEIQAPMKGYIEIGNGASHSAMVTEPHAFAQALLDDVRKAGCR